jgi:uncharacterized protein
MTKEIRVRAPRFDLSSVPADWLAGDPVASDLVDALSLIFPEGERFFIRSVLHFAEAYESDPALRAAVKGFVGQEGRHGHEHERMNRMIKGGRGSQRAEATRRFLTFYRRAFYGGDGQKWGIEQIAPPVLRLSATAALEHMTATLAEVALGGKVLEDAHPEIARMLRWHAVEEIEHRAVSFDVLERVDARLRTRVAGVGIGLGVLGVAWVVAFAHLRASNPAARSGENAAARRFWGRAGRAVPEVARALRRYVSRDFHPDADGRAHEAKDVRARLERVQAAYEQVLMELAA